MSRAIGEFYRFVDEHIGNPRLYEPKGFKRMIELAQAIHDAEECGFVIDSDSVYEACATALEG